MDNVLESQFRSCEELATRVANGEGNYCQQIESLMDLVTAMFGVAQSGVARWHQRVERGEATYQIEKAREFERLYQVLAQAADSLVRASRRMTAKGYPVEGVEKFAVVHEELRLLAGLSVDQIQKAEEQVRLGKTRPLGDVRDELRRRIHG